MVRRSRMASAQAALLACAAMLSGCSGQQPPAAGTDSSGADGASPASRAAMRPNILLVISDDVGLDVTSDMYPGLIDALSEAYGPGGHAHPQYTIIDGRAASTPTLAGIARDGMVFTNVWAHPFCSPTRAAILTGLFGAGTNVLTYADPLSQHHTSFVEILRQGGYRTGLFGKWHLAGLPGEQTSYPGIKPKEAGFDIFRGNFHAAITTFWEYDYEEQDAATPAGAWRTRAAPQRALPGIGPTRFAPVVKAADALQWIAEQEAADPDQPWFAWLAFNLSHATIAREPSQMAIPDADTLDAVSLAEMQACGGVFGTQDTGQCSGEAVMRAMTNALDTVTGRVIDAINEIDPNTYVIYIGDNGTPMYGRPGLDFIDNMYITRTGRGKGTSYESGARVPLAVSGPGIAAGTVSNEFAHAADLFATIPELAGLQSPTRVATSDGAGTVAPDARSLVPILMRGAAAVRDPDTGYILSESSNLMTGGTNQVGARNARYKLICTGSAAADDCEFYDLERDPLEEFELARPESCSGFTGGNPGMSQAWHFCRLQDVIATRSFLPRVHNQ